MARKEAIFKMKVDSDDAVKDVRKLDQDMTHLADTIGVEVSSSISAMEDKLYDLSLAGKQNTKEFKDLQAQTAKYKQVIIETDRSIDQLAEQGRGLSTALSLAEGTVAGFQAYTGVTAILGDENEELLETITKLQAAQGVLNGIMVIREQLQKNAIKLSQAQAAVQKALNVVMKANPIGLIITAIAALIAGITALIMNFEAITNWLGITDDAAETLHKENLRRTEEFIKQQGERINAISKERSEIERLRNFENKMLEAKGASEEEVFKAVRKTRLERIKSNNEFQRQIKQQNDALISQFKLLQISGDLTKEQADEINAKIESNNEMMRAAALEAKDLLEQVKLDDVSSVREAEEEKANIRKEAWEKRKAAIIAEMDEEARLRNDTDAFIKELEERLQAESDAEVGFRKEHLKRMQSLEDEIGGSLDAELAVEEAKQDAARETERIKREEAEKTRAMQVANADQSLQLTSDSVGAISGLYSQLAGKNEAAQKKVFNVNKAVSIAQAIVSTSQGIMAQLAVPQDALTGANFVKAGVVAVTGATQIAKIASTKFNSGGSGGGSSAPSLQGATAGSFSTNQNTNNQNTTDLNPDGSVNNGMGDGIKVIVTETDITNIQNKVAKTQALATF